MMPGAGSEVNTTLPLVLNIVGAIICCGLADILFILGIVFAVQAGKALKTGDMATAAAKRKTSMTMAIIGYALGAVLDVLYAVSQAMR